jgi:hypothetical protein
MGASLGANPELPTGQFACKNAPIPDILERLCLVVALLDSKEVPEQLPCSTALMSVTTCNEKAALEGGSHKMSFINKNMSIAIFVYLTLKKCS